MSKHVEDVLVTAIGFMFIVGGGVSLIVTSAIVFGG
jgi:hypothetical protein